LSGLPGDAANATLVDFEDHSAKTGPLKTGMNEATPSANSNAENSRAKNSSAPSW
jgi:hypothetical protein